MYRTLVIVENVQNAKWDYMVHKFNNLDYDADAVLLNTADYYIPHIRHRGYMLCIDRERAGKDGIGATYKWTQLMDRFRRRASVPVTEFLLADDDPRVLRARSAISKLEKKTSKESSWYTCEARGNEEREKYQLGDLRPLTNWTVSGVAEVPEGFVVEWFRPQSKRVYEFIDIAWLRNVLNERGAFDSRFKTRCWDVSQNIDLQKDNQAFGITQCITPTGDVLITNRGRAFTGYESLRLQGIPIDDLSFTIEGNKRLLDLAGNAMTATVVGPSLLAALIVAGEKLTKSRPTVQLSPAKDAAQQSLGIRSTATTTSHVTLGTQKTFNFSNMILDADRSASYCRCEGPYITSRAPVLRCEVCDHTTCQKCSGPKHSYGPNALGADERMDAIEFENKWRHHFPPILRVFGTPDVKSLCEAQGSQLGNIGDAIQDHITNAFNEPVNFQGFRRGPCWTATYQSSTVTLMLLIREAPEWQLSLKPHPALPGNSQVRRILEWPIARAKVSDSLHTIDSTWEWRIPMQQVFDFKVTALGESLPSWRARGGLLEAAGETVPSGFEITAPEGLTKLLHEDLSGVYRLFDNCATPCDILYRQTQSDGHSPLYLFLECSDIGDPALDRLVFARQTQSQNSKIKPEILAVLPKGWRPWSSKLTARSTIKVDLCATWTSSDNARISVKAVELPIELSKPRSSSDVFLPDNSCTNALTMLSTNFSDASLGHRWKLSQRIKVDDKEFWSAFSSLLFPHHELPSLREWTNVSSDGRSGHCSNCAPATPTLQWRWDTTKSSVDKDDKLVSFEDAREAGLFERKFKQRPPLFAIQLSSEAKSVTVKLAVNLHALIHRVSALLEHLPTSPVFSWRILHDHVPGVMADFLPFVSTGTNGDKSFNGPLDLNIPLRLEQLRSLTWMRNCESDHASPFLVEAIEEAILPEMRWRAEARVQKATQVKGGVLADRVGFGKTALILALIESDLRELDAVRASSPDNSTLANQQTAGLIPLCGTLVIVPKQMPLEWKNEITKFLPPARFSGRNLVIVNTPKDLNGLTVQDFQDAKIVVVNWTVLEHDSYIKALAGFAAMPEPSSTKGRSFATWMRSASGRMTEHVGLLKRLGNKDFDKEARSRYRDNSSSDEFQRVVPTKRKKGAKYISANARQMAQPSVTNSGETPLQPAGHGSKGPWTNRSYPLFHMFGWRRVVVDEFPYLNSNNLASISSLQTDRRWVLSATPKLTDFMEVKKVGELLGVDLGPDAVPEGASPTRLKQLLAEKTQAEVFHIYREIKSPEWAEARHQYAQRFVDTFVRQNETDVDNIEVEEHLCPSTLSAEWRILYEETLRHFTSKGMELIKPDSESTAPQRLISSLMSDCNSAEEVLLRTVLNPRSNDEAGGPLTFAHLEEERQNDLIASETRVSDLLYRCWGLRNYLRDEKLPKWDDWEANEADLGDADATRRLRGILTRVKKQSNTVKGNHEDLRKSVQKLREECYGGLLLCVRTLRSLQALLRLQEASVNTTLCDGARCSGNHSVDEVYLLPACGHLVCDVCHDAGTVNNKCVAPGCRSDLDGKGLIGRSDIALPSRSDLPVTKIESIVTVLQGLSKDDQALIFVQGDTMTDVVAAGLSDADIKHKAIRSSAEDIGAVADDFRADSNIKALVLDFESGAGL